MRNSPATEFELLWKSTGSLPDVFQFLSSSEEISLKDIVAVIGVDQQYRWRPGSPLPPVPVEDYLAKYLELETNPDLLLEFSVNEFRSRRWSGERPSKAEFVKRFSTISELLLKTLTEMESGSFSSEADADEPADQDDTNDELDFIGEAFEKAWHDATATPNLEEYLHRGSENIRAKLARHLLLIELWHRQLRGEKPTLSEYRTRFLQADPVLQDLLREWEANPGEFLQYDDSSEEQQPVPPGLMENYSPRFAASADAVGGSTFGRYRLIRILGKGTFGIVYLGRDDVLKRFVAIKVPTKARFQKPEDAEAYLAEARMVSSLDHPHIVKVHDAGYTHDGSIYVVYEFIEGSSLEERIKASHPAIRESAQLLATVALALQYAHQRKVIHRDVKPANILIQDKTDKPYVADFGLAIQEEDYLQQDVIAGTPAYMSPEQARGEGHRLDGRSDIFSMGVILYELLTGKKPFVGGTLTQVLDQVKLLPPQPPRELLDTIPAELERICLKALSKQASDRYATAAEFADDLGQWLKPTTAVSKTTATVQVVPKGLRSFDAGDADFFLDLLPGARNRDGLPESIAFWKRRIEQTDHEQAFSVGLIYGPSGCGKSSLVKAGLLPHLSDSIIAVYVEATPEDTEARILRGLRKRLDNPALGLADTLAAVRRGKSRKVVIIIDQFEQWLHAHRADPEAELVKALRQCDGERLQAIIMVRDDFYVATDRLMKALDIRLDQSRNSALIDLFDIDNAAKVLTKFGQAFGKLPANAGNMTAGEQQFVSDVSAGLAQEGKVVSVRLSLFAEMVKGKPWTPATLKQVGGTEGIGANFLEETFVSQSASPKYRQHEKAARGVLRALLPELGTDIKGQMRSLAELQMASGYQDRQSDFTDLLRILDSELRLITPTDPQGQDKGEMRKEEGKSKPAAIDSSFVLPPSSFRYYQLTHDYLVPSLREWLTRKQQETRKGRAELMLVERCAIWNAKRENKQLPTVAEWLSIRVLTDSRRWKDSQRAMMRKAARVHGLRTGTAMLLVLILILTGLSINKAVNDRREELVAQKQEERNQAEATRLVEGLLVTDTSQVTGTLDSLKEFRSWADPQMEQAFEESPARLRQSWYF